MTRPARARRGLRGAGRTTRAALPAPPDAALAPTLARSAPVRATTLIKVTGAVLVLTGLTIVGHGGIHRGALRELLLLGAVVSAGLALILFRSRRNLVLVGPGWLAAREYLRTRWVRVDQLDRCRVTQSGLERLVILTDTDGRKVGVMLSDVLVPAPLRRQLRSDLQRSLQRKPDLAQSSGFCELLEALRP